MIGVLPAAMRTIIVSPTARPNPIMTAEKRPLIAVGTTTRMAVCHVVAPAPSEPARSDCGTAVRASSAIVKMIGMTAKPIVAPTTKALRWT